MGCRAEQWRSVPRLSHGAALVFGRDVRLMSYVELHARSAFSFLEGASAPEELVSRCADLESPAMAILDRNSLSGAVRFHQQAVKSKVRALVGAEVTAKEGFRYALLA